MTQGITNSSYQDYSLSQSQSASSGDEVNKDQFLKLLTYQLKAQNPLKPYDNQEFASQLAQFSQLEQMTDIRSLLEEQVQTNLILTNTISNTALPGLLGKSAKALSDSVQLNQDETANIGYTLPYRASSGEIAIKDESGNTVRNITLEELDLLSGDHKLVWDGTDNDGNQLAAGDYTFEVSAYDSQGGTVSATTFTYGTLSAVKFTSDGTKLVMNGVEIPLENVLDISTDA